MVDRGLWFEEFEVGQEFETDEREVGQSDVAAFAEVSGDRNPLHLDEEYAAAGVFGRRVAHGMLGLSVATGLLNRLGLTAGTLAAFLGVTWDFRRPLYPGEAVRLHLRVARLRRTGGGDRGVVVLEGELLDREDETLQEGELRFLVRGRPDGADPTTPGRTAACT